MFTTSIKNPLEAETVGQRRERKAKESEGSVRSSRSSFSTRRETKSVKSKKFNVIEAFSKAPKTCVATGDDHLESNVRQPGDISRSELPASPGQSPASESSPLWPYSQGYCELSTSPSVSKHKTREPQSSQPLDSSRTLIQEPQRGLRRLQSFAFAGETSRTKPDTPVQAIDLVPSVEPNRNVAGQTARHRRDWSYSDRPGVTSYPSSLSTCSAIRSETFSAARSISEEMHRPNMPNMHKSNVLAELGQHVSTESELDLIPSVSFHLQSKPDSESAYLLGPVPRRVPVRRNNPKWSVESHPLEDRFPLMLRLMQAASNEIHCQRLCEHWDGVSPDLTKLIHFEKRLWALNGLKRLDDLQMRRERISDGSRSPVNGDDATVLVEDAKNVLYICVDGGMSCSPNEFSVYECRLQVSDFLGYLAESLLHTATSHNAKIHCLMPSDSLDLTFKWNSHPNMETNYWADIPALPYGDSFMDLISSRSIALILRSSQWPVFVQECVRVLRPGGALEVTILDPMPRNCGPLLRRWTAKNLILGLEKRFLVTQPAMIIPMWLDDISDFGRRDRVTLAYSATADEVTLELSLASQEVVDNHPQSEEADRSSRRDLQRLRTAVGCHFYQALYNDLVPEVSQRQPGNSELEGPRESTPHWWWKDLAILRECKEQRTLFEMVTYKCRKNAPAQLLAQSQLCYVTALERGRRKTADDRLGRSD